MAEGLVVLDGNCFFLTDGAGDVDSVEGPGGFFHSDTRHLSRWCLRIDGLPVRVLTSRVLDYYSARVFAMPAGELGPDPSLAIRRDRIIGGGVHEEISLQNHRSQTARIELELDFDADFIDVFEVRYVPKRPRQVVRAQLDRAVRLSYRTSGFGRSTLIQFDRDVEITPQGVRASVLLPARGRWTLAVDISVGVGGDQPEIRPRHDASGRVEPQMPLSLSQWMEAAPRLETQHDGLRHTYERSLVDLAALRFRPTSDADWTLPAAGLPWFMALFGRDSLITSYQLLPFQPHLAQASLETLARLQARETDDFRDADPGKILHELRCGELAATGVVPHSPYYGSHDATPLFLILLDEYERWTGDMDLVRRLESHARDAIAWLEGPADLDGDGYIEYRTRSRQGLRNQCWKDSWNSILFADGRPAEPPIATCELQGYAYDARLRAARLARAAWSDEALAERLEDAARALYQNFNNDFWLEARGTYALALDGEKRPVDSMTSNAGQLLWSGIVPSERAAILTGSLLDEDMFSGWGVRTMSQCEAGYNPLSYHNGTVWPHDTALVAEGMRRYGFRAEAARLAVALIEAAGHFDYRLPEVFAGLPRAETAVPVEYPTPARPQAWAAGAPLLGLRTLLGMDVVDGKLESWPAHSPGLGPLRLRDVPVHGRHVDTPPPVPDG
jgi:glycogen debranching enzyme